MPLHFHKKISNQGEVGLWKIEEDEIFFLEQLQLEQEEEQYIADIKGHRRLEWLASRFLLHKMSGRTKRSACIKDDNGKPFLVDSLFDISLSHSREFAAVIAAPQAVGIDIQKVVDKIDRIAHKFMRDEETESLQEATRLEHLHVYWGAKEALYKAYGRRQLDFKEHIFITPFEYDLADGTFSGYYHKGEEYKAFDLKYELVERDYVLVYGMERIALF
jgi:4'-phosphopantetheinyl transferase